MGDRQWHLNQIQRGRNLFPSLLPLVFRNVDYCLHSDSIQIRMMISLTEFMPLLVSSLHSNHSLVLIVWEKEKNSTRTPCSRSSASAGAAAAAAELGLQCD